MPSPSVKRQDYPGDRYEVIIADGGQAPDATREIVARLSAGGPARIRLIDNPRAHPGSGDEPHDPRRPRHGSSCAWTSTASTPTTTSAAASRRWSGTGADNVRRSAAIARQDLLPEGALRGAGEPARRWGRQVPGRGLRGLRGHRLPRRLPPARVSRAWGSTTRTPSPTRTPSSISGSSARGGKVFLSKDIVVHYYPRPSMKTLSQQYFKYGRGRARDAAQAAAVPVRAPGHPLSHGVRRHGAPRHQRHPALHPPSPSAPYAAGTFLEAVRVGRKAGAAGHPGGVGHLPGAPRLARDRLRRGAPQVPSPPGLGRAGAPRSDRARRGRRPTRRRSREVGLFGAHRRDPHPHSPLHPAAGVPAGAGGDPPR